MKCSACLNLDALYNILTNIPFWALAFVEPQTFSIRTCQKKVENYCVTRKKRETETLGLKEKADCPTSNFPNLEF